MNATPNESRDAGNFEDAGKHEIVYALEPHLSAADFIDVLIRSTLAARRPIDNPETIEGMLRHASLIVTARSQQQLVGVSRALTDFSYCTYLSDLAVDQTYQQQGIGRRLIERTHQEAGLNTTLILLAAPAARSYYPHIGMQPHDSCWTIPRR
jgi:GNAT superfamily N-acetyltransferase